MKNIIDVFILYICIHICSHEEGEEKNVKDDDGIYIFTAARQSSSHVCIDEHGKHVNKIILFKWMIFNWCKRSKIKFISVTRAGVCYPQPEEKGFFFKKYWEYTDAQIPCILHTHYSIIIIHSHMHACSHCFHKRGPLAFPSIILKSISRTLRLCILNMRVRVMCRCD